MSKIMILFAILMVIFLFGCSTATSDNLSDSGGSGNTNPTTPLNTTVNESPLTEIKVNTSDFYRKDTGEPKYFGNPEVYQVKSSTIGILPISKDSDTKITVDGQSIESVLSGGFYQVDVGNVGQTKVVTIKTESKKPNSFDGLTESTYTLNITHVDAYDNDATLTQIGTSTGGGGGDVSADVTTYTFKPKNYYMSVWFKKANKGSTFKVTSDYFIFGNRKTVSGGLNKATGLTGGGQIVYQGNTVAQMQITGSLNSYNGAFGHLELATDFSTGYMDRSTTVYKTTIEVTSKDGTQTKLYTVYLDCVNVEFP